jgi:DNA-binding GntR family transcriptional regulator
METKVGRQGRRTKSHAAEVMQRFNIRSSPRIERSALSTQVSTTIVEGLLDGRLRPGDRLVETQLANVLGVSRSPIREALTELAQSGVIIREPGRGGRIREWTRKDLEDLYGVRGVLEGYAIRLTVPKMTNKAAGMFEELIAAMRTAGIEQDYMTMIELDLAFHRTIWRLTKNPLLEQVLEGLSQQFKLFLTLNWKFHGGLEDVADKHHVLLAALTSGNVERAEAAMREHVVVVRMTEALTSLDQHTDRAG